MALVINGLQRASIISIIKTGNDGSITIMSPTSTPAYRDFDIKSDAYGLTEITEDEYQKLSESDFTERVNEWKSHLQSAYAVSDPNLWSDISDSFRYINGLVVRLYDSGGGNVRTTVKGYINNGSTFSTKIVDSNGNVRHQFDITPGNTESTDSWLLSGVTLQNIIDENLFKFLNNSITYNHPILHLTAFVDIDGIYPLPI